jgi:hypothetical protein
LDPNGNNVTVFNIANDGTLTQAAGPYSPPSQGNGPSSVAINSANTYAYFASAFSYVNAYSIAGNGSLTLVTGSPYTVSSASPGLESLVYFGGSSGYTANDSTGVCYARVNTTNPVTSDNCSIAKLTWVMTGATSAASSNSGINDIGSYRFNTGITTVTYTVTDGSNNTASASFTVTVTDSIPPSITCPNAITINTNVACTSTQSIGTATATDNCTANPTITNNHTGAFSGITTVTWQAQDAAGNTSTCNQVVTVTDTIVPVITCPNAITINTTSACSSTQSIGTATATDNCAGSPTITNNNGGPYSGTSTVTWQAQDASGNTSTCNQVVTVTDTIVPVITCPNAITIHTTVNCTSNQSIGTATATDNCTASPTITNNNSGPYSGITTVTWKAQDASGNTSTCNQVVTVTDTIAPVVSNCPSSYTATRSCPGSVTWPSGAIANDNCGTISSFGWALSGATTASGASSTYTYASFGDGVTTVTYTATDAAGNTGTCTFTISILQLSVSDSSTQYNGVNIKCNGGSTGIIMTKVTNGTGPFTYAWTPSEGTVATASGLGAGAYTVTVTASGPCTATATYTETQPSTALSATATTTKVIGCFYSHNGAISLTPSGGTPSYTYSWSGVVNNGYTVNGTYPTSTSQNLSSLDSGVYTVTITDANGCTKTLKDTVSSPAALRVQFQLTAPTCYNSNNGNITLLATERGNPTPFTPYNYSDNNGATFQSSPNFFANLNTGTYTLIVTDAHGCTSTDTSPDTVISFGPSPVTISVTRTSNTMTVTAGGGIAPYKFKQNGGTATSESNPYTYTAITTPYSVSGCTGYSYIVLDHNSCQSPTVGPYKLSGCGGARDILPENSNTTLFVYPNPASDRITVLFSANAEESYNLRFFDILGQLIQSQTGSTSIGDNQLEVNLSTIAKGVYIVDLQHGTTSGKLRIVVQ